MTRYITRTIPITISTFEGGLNTGELGLKENESDDLANMEFDKFGSILKRKGYLWLNAVPIPFSSAPNYAVIFDTCGAGDGTAIPPMPIRYTIATGDQVDHE